MKKLEEFLKSWYYIALVFLITLIAWSFYKDDPQYTFNRYNMLFVYSIILANAIVLGMFKNTLYSIPLVFSLLFIINEANISFENAGEIGFPSISLITFILGYSVYFLRFKPSIRFKKFALGLLLIAVSYIIPLLYIDFSWSSFSVSMMGFIFFGLYLFYSNTLKGDFKYLFTLLVAINLLLVYQVGFYLFQGFILNPNLPFDERLNIGWGRNLGWGNINDVCFYLSLTIPAYLYFIFRKPHSVMRWLIVILPISAIVLTKSRGGLIGLVVALIGIVFVIFYKGSKMHKRNILISFVVLLLFGVFAYQLLFNWIQRFVELLVLGADGFTSNRLFIYRHAWEIFLEYPLFGAGWISITRVFEAWLETFGTYHRIFMYHSTLFQALAAMGLFGLFALIIHYIQIFKYFFRDVSLEKYIFIIGYIATQVHGLVENVQYSVPYSILIVIIIAIFETSERKTDFSLVNKVYVFDSKESS